MDLQNFKGIVSSISRRVKGNSYINRDDVEQELWIKLLQLSENERFKRVSLKDQQRIAYRSLKNRVIDLIRFQSRRKDSSVFTQKIDTTVGGFLGEAGESSYVAIESAANYCDEVLNFRMNSLRTAATEAMENLSYADLVNEIYAWAKQQDANTYTVIHNQINPLPSVEAWWREFSRESRHHRNKSFIPGELLCDYFGFHRSVYKRALPRLRRHLRTAGYAP